MSSKNVPKSLFFLNGIRNRYLLAMDVLFIALGAIISFDLRLDTWFPTRVIEALALYVAVALLVRPSVLVAAGTYQRYWLAADADDFLQLVVAISVSSLIMLVLFAGILLPLDMVHAFPRSVLLIDWLACLLLIISSRFLLRRLNAWSGQARKGENSKQRPVLIAGAGSAGTQIAREIANNPQIGLKPVGFVDDNPAKLYHRVNGIPVLGNTKDIPALVLRHRFSLVIIAMPSASGSVIRQIREACNKSGVEVRTMPALYEILSGTVSVQQIREVQIEDLLRRQPVSIDAGAVNNGLKGRRIAVTGAGGSIGRELCRQVALANPELLLLIGHGENSIFEIDQELRRSFPQVVTQPVVADVRNRTRLEDVFSRSRPEVVFHAAAHKHVPLMEHNVVEAVTNNVLGTRNVTRAAEQFAVDRLVMISTDKAVRPTSVMGMTKRLAEMIVQESAVRTGRPYAAVRFGNVLNSRGSVITVFKEQIRAGGPVTVTHPDMTRYFMTIPEAVQLVLQAGVQCLGGEIFVLDMGEPIKILDLARDLVELSGLKPYEDIDIVFTGIRPGEKLSENLFYSGEHMEATRHDQILVAQDGHLTLAGSLDALIDQLDLLADSGRDTEIRQVLRRAMIECHGGDQVPTGAAGGD